MVHAPRLSGAQRPSKVIASVVATTMALVFCGSARAASDGAAVPDLVRASSDPAVERLLASMTLEEKIDLLGDTGFATKAIPRVGIPAFKMSDGPVGARSPAPPTAYAAGIGSEIRSLF
jgi:beta-glucosidase